MVWFLVIIAIIVLVLAWIGAHSDGYQIIQPKHPRQFPTFTTARETASQDIEGRLLERMPPGHREIPPKSPPPRREIQKAGGSTRACPGSGTTQGAELPQLTYDTCQRGCTRRNHIGYHARRGHGP